MRRDRQQDPYRCDFDVFNAKDRERWLDPNRTDLSPPHGHDVMGIFRALFGDRCVYCWRTGLELTRDHVDARGDHDMSNIVPACRGCNGGKCRRGVLSLVGRLEFDYVPRFMSQCSRLKMTPAQWRRFSAALRTEGLAPHRY